MSHRNRPARSPAPAPARGASSENIPRSANHVVRAVQSSSRRSGSGYVRVEINQLEDAWTELTLLEKKLEAMLSKKLEAETRFEQVKSQLGRAGMTFARGSLPFPPRHSHHDRHHADQRAIVTVGRGSTHEATVPVRFNELQAAWIRLSKIKAELKSATSKELEYRIKIEQGEEQLRRAGRIRPSQGLLPSTPPTTNRISNPRSSTNRSSR